MDKVSFRRALLLKTRNESYKCAEQNTGSTISVCQIILSVRPLNRHMKYLCANKCIYNTKDF